MTERPPELRGWRLVGFWLYVAAGFGVMAVIGAVALLWMLAGGGP